MQLLGVGGQRAVRLWLRSPGGGPHRLVLWPEDAPSARIEYPFDMGDARHVETVRALELDSDVEARILSHNAEELLER